MRTPTLAGVLFAALVAIPAVAVAQPPDRIFYNGKIVTVDARFRIARALAIRGDRIVAVGDDRTVRALAGTKTVQADLHGRTVVPGLIDSHVHYLRGVAFASEEVRWQGLTSRAAALDAISAKARASAPGAWIFVFGGWNPQQFADRPGDFTEEELDRAAPQNPVFIQFMYTAFYMNGLARREIAPAIGPLYKGGSIVRTNSEDGRIVMYAALKHFPFADGVDGQERQVRAYNRFLASVGLTTVYDVGYIDGSYEPVARLARRNELGLRVFHTARYWAETPWTATAAAEQLDREKPFARTNRFGLLGVGEHVYGPLHDGLLDLSLTYPRAVWDEFEKIATAAARGRWPITEHVQLDQTARTMLDVGERIAARYPIKDLRWTLGHVDTVRRDTLERAKRLGWVASVANHVVKPLVRGQPDVRALQDSGITWGLSSDGTVVGTANPFDTLWEFTSGKIFPDIEKYAPAERLTREEALVAHTRSNAYLLFLEKDLGSLEPGKLADLVVLDRDYLTVPVDEIRRIQPVLTMVGGRVVHRRPGT